MMRRTIRLVIAILLLVLSFHLFSRLLLWRTWGGLPTDAKYSALGLGGTLSALSFLMSTAVGSLLRRFTDSTRIEDPLTFYPRTFAGTFDTPTGEKAALDVRGNPGSLRGRLQRDPGHTERSFFWVGSIVPLETFEDMGK